jgi:hypothetical protein
VVYLFWLLILVPVVAGLAAQQRLLSVFARYRGISNRAGVTGAQVARALLDAHGLARVRLELTPGFLSDRYDGEAQALSLSEVVAGERSVAAIGIAAHEVSHALQDAEGSRVYRVRRRAATTSQQGVPSTSLRRDTDVLLEVGQRVRSAAGDERRDDIGGVAPFEEPALRLGAGENDRVPVGGTGIGAAEPARGFAASSAGTGRCGAQVVAVRPGPKQRVHHRQRPPAANPRTG